MADKNDNGNKAQVNIELVETLTALRKRMQTGVAFCEQAKWEQAGIHPVIARELKHLRVGVNAAMTETAALAELMIERGIFTRDDYARACIKTMQAEVDRYTEQIRKETGASITLGEAGAFTAEDKPS